MFDRIKTYVRDNKEHLVIGFLGATTGVLAVYSVQTKKKWDITSAFTRSVMDALNDGLVPTLIDEGRTISFAEPECHCPTEKPKATRAKAAA